MILTENRLLEAEKYTLERVIQFVQKTIDDMTKTSVNDAGITPEEYTKRENKRRRLQQALKECSYCSRPDKEFVKDFIYDLLSRMYGVNENNVNFIIDFEDMEALEIRDKFDILMHKYKTAHGKAGLARFIKKYSMDELRTIDDMQYYCITRHDIGKAFENEKLRLTYKDKLEIVVQRVYSSYKGYNCIDDVLDMQIDGVCGGVNGLPENYIYDHSAAFEEYLDRSEAQKIPRSYESVWLFFEGKPIHLKFLSFGSYNELKRICENIYKFGSPGQLSQAAGYKVNKLKDGSRVVVLRPELSESWAFFVRKFEVPVVSLKSLITDKNSEILVELLSFLVKGARNIAITGAQGTGKTTLLNALLEHIYSAYTLRILEMAFELHVRKRFPNRNVLTIQETDTVSGQEGLDILKKTDGVVSIIGEVASDPVAAYMIQTAQVASLFTIFSHHAKTFKELVMSLRNSLLKTGFFSNEVIAEEQIIRVLNFDIHLEKNLYGKRYIERVTECIPVEDEDYPCNFRIAENIGDKLDAFMETTLAFYKKVTGRRLYTYRDIIVFDIDRNEYSVRNRVSEMNLRDMLKAMTTEDRTSFKAFCEKHFKDLED